LTAEASSECGDAVRSTVSCREFRALRMERCGWFARYAN
jgi:hypothetical protein